MKYSQKLGSLNRFLYFLVTDRFLLGYICPLIALCRFVVVVSFAYYKLDISKRVKSPTKYIVYFLYMSFPLVIHLSLNISSATVSVLFPLIVF